MASYITKIPEPAINAAWTKVLIASALPKPYLCSRSAGLDDIFMAIKVTNDAKTSAKLSINDDNMAKEPV